MLILNPTNIIKPQSRRVMTTKLRSWLPKHRRFLLFISTLTQTSRSVFHQPVSNLWSNLADDPLHLLLIIWHIPILICGSKTYLFGQTCPAISRNKGCEHSGSMFSPSSGSGRIRRLVCAASFQIWGEEVFCIPTGIANTECQIHNEVLLLFMTVLALKRFIK